MANINELLARAAALRDETQLNSISPERAGGIMYDTLLAMNELWLQQGAALVISKIYASVAAMEADTAPVSDLTGLPLRPGQIVVIASSDSDNGSVYRYNGTSSPSWSLVGEIGNLEPVDSLNSDSTSLPLAAHQGKVLDGKISQLGQVISEFSGVKWNENGIINKDTGAISVIPNRPDLIYTDFIRVSAGCKVHYQLQGGNIAVIAMYNSNQSYIVVESLIGDGSLQAGTLIIPSGINYIRACNNLNSNPNVSLVITDNIVTKVAELIEDTELYSPKFDLIGFIDKNSGGFVAMPSNPSLVCTDFFEVNEGDTIKYSLSFANAAYLAAYTQEKEYNQAQSLIATDATIHTGTFIVPSGIKYIRACNSLAVTMPILVNESAKNVRESIFSLKDTASFINTKVKPKYKYQIGDSLDKPTISFSGKSIAGFGDSITRGYASSPDGGISVDSYLARIANKLGATLTNYAVNNAHYTTIPGVTAKTISEQIDDAIGTTPDIVWVAAGVNDFVHGATLGSIEDTGNTFYGAIAAVCDKIALNFPNAKVYFLTPINLTHAYLNQSTNGLDAFRSAIYEVATLNGYNVISGESIGMPKVPGGWNNLIIRDSDGCHPTDFGHGFMAKNIIGKLF